MSDDFQSYDDLIAELRAAANRWMLLARDHARESKLRSVNGDSQSSYYHRGMAESYHKLSLELAELVKRAPARSVMEPQPTAAAAEPGEVYADVSLGEVMRLLEYTGITARELKRHDDGVFTAIFSRWQPFSEHERIDMLKRADMRIVVLDVGRLPDTNDPYLDFAFKA